MTGRLTVALWAGLLGVLAGCATGPAVTPPPEPPMVQAVAPAASAPVVVAVAPAASAPEPAPAPEPVDPLRPEVRLDLDDRATRIDLWERVRSGMQMPDLENERVRQWERWYADRPDYVQRMTERGGRYLFHIVEELEKRGMPMDLALLPFIESAFNPEAMSSARASGMWQFMPGTGRVFELRQNMFRDDRRDVLASTRAALDYLQKLHGMFDDWQLALAAYNWGEGNVARAIARNRRAGKPTDYESLRMPAETRNYVPKLQAVKNIVRRPADFQLTLPELSNHPYFLAVPIERDIDVELAAQLADLPLDEFKALNPQMNRPVILAAATPQVLLPYDNANLFVRRLPGHAGPLASWTAWVAPKTLSPAAAAKMVGMEEDELREINRIPPRMLVRAGSTLLVARNDERSGDVSEHLADNAVFMLAPDEPSRRRVALRAGRRDSVASIARRYKVSAEQVAHWNGVPLGSTFRRGQTIIVYVAPKAVHKVTTRKPSAASAKKPARKPAAKKPARQGSKPAEH
ncbi:MAG: transglycosylase SLT domain-containing protein [Piscinibacter sp.]|nr:transglycosylase SLT domain-containing protein [Piscinibacter sp.]